MIIDGEQAYPIYKISINWVQNGIQRSDYGGNHKGLRKGRIWNSMCPMLMAKEEKTDKELIKEAKVIFRNSTKNKENPSRPKIKIEFLRYETWCIHWFSHWTFDIGQTDEEALISFGNFVRRTKEVNRKNGHGEHDHILSNKNPYYCLMGAEDRWRWFGDDNDGNPTEPPCRCKHCKKQGKIRINH